MEILTVLTEIIKNKFSGSETLTLALKTSGQVTLIGYQKSIQFGGEETTDKGRSNGSFDSKQSFDYRASGFIMERFNLASEEPN